MKLNELQHAMFDTLVSSAIAKYTLAAQSAQRGCSRLHRKVRARDEEIQEYREFLELRQLDGEFDGERTVLRVAKRDAYFKEQDRLARLDAEGEEGEIATSFLDGQVALMAEVGDDVEEGTDDLQLGL